MTGFALRGQIVYADSPDRLTIRKDAYLCCGADGACAGVLDALPAAQRDLPVLDFGDALIIPGLVDLHLHASQYAFCGAGGDDELIDWLNGRAFPEEARFADASYAASAYARFVDDLRRGCTTSACVFATIHDDATRHLMALLNEAGLRAMVGKVSMNRNAPQALLERDALDAAARWAAETRHLYPLISPILTPRFIPSCDDQLLRGLGALARETGLPVQSHLSENPDEIRWVGELCPDDRSYTCAYDRFGLLGASPTVMAHGVYLDPAEMALLAARGTTIAHCPVSNTDLRSGIAPVRRLLEAGVRVGLGTDVAGGHTLSLLRVMSEAIGVSKLYARYIDERARPLSLTEAFYLATRGGGAFFGAVGTFAPGASFDALVLDDDRLDPAGRPIPERLERFIQRADDRALRAKFVAGRRVIL